MLLHECLYYNSWGSDCKFDVFLSLNEWNKFFFNIFYFFLEVRNATMCFSFAIGAIETQFYKFTQL